MPEVDFHIDLDLGNYKSIQKAEKMLGRMSRDIDNSIEDAMREIASKMKDKAQESLTSYGLGGSEVASSLEIIEREDGISLYNSSDHADYVEFGTGIRGAESPHPNPVGWEYDINDHGEGGWLYTGSDGKLHWTAGMPSRPFMYTSWLYGARIAGSQVTKHINRLIRRSTR